MIARQTRSRNLRRARHSTSVRFTAPVFPGETIRTEMWNMDEGLSFRSRAVERDAVVLGSGWAEFNA